MGTQALGLPHDASGAATSRAIRALIVIGIAVVLIGGSLPNVYLVMTGKVGNYLLSIGSYSRSGGTVTEVDASSDAWRAGLRAGDRIIPHSYADRLVVQGLSFAPAGHKVTVDYIRDGVKRTTTLTAEPNVPSEAFFVLPLKRLVYVLFILTGAALVLLRPSRMTWAFYWYACGSAPGVPIILGYLGVPWPVYFVVGTAYYILSTSVASSAFLIFATRFPDDAPTGWRRKIDSAVPLIFAALVVVTLINLYAYFIAGSAVTDRLWPIMVSGFIGVYVLGFVALVTTYFGSAGSARQRTSWVITGLTISVIVLGAQALDDLINFWPSRAVGADVLSVLNVAVPLTVAYAVLRHNILDIRFVISRALVYGVLTSILVVVFALIDWIFVKQLANTNLGIVAEISTAVGLGFSLNSLHHRVDQFIDSVFFRQRYLMEKRLVRVANSLPHAISADFVDETLVAEPHDALHLASCAVFRRGGGGVYVRMKSLGWTDNDCRTLDLNDPMMLQLVAEQSPLDLQNLRWPRADLPTGAARAALAVPILVRRQMIGIALYGSRAVGEALDPDEVKSLSALGSGAAVAYDHIEAEELRQKIDAVVRENQALRIALAPDAP